MVQKHPGRDVPGFGKIECLRPEWGQGDGEQDERAREHRDQPRTRMHRHAPILRNSLQRYFPQLTVVASNDLASSTGSWSSAPRVGLRGSEPIVMRVRPTVVPMPVPDSSDLRMPFT